jgi:Raf kinase inhibitor-like YbhB/YbcL family protein
MKIQSPAFQDKQRIPPMYTCDEDDVNPQFLISEVPEGARSLALIMDDPDSPTGTWVHWTVWNISPQITEIAENSVPEGAVEGMTSFGKTGYGGPCPHSGEHRYFFKLYALDTTLDLPAGADISQLNQAMQSHILEQAQLMGLYSR